MRRTLVGVGCLLTAVTGIGSSGEAEARGCIPPGMTPPAGWHPITRQVLDKALDAIEADEITRKNAEELRDYDFYDSLRFQEPYPDFNTRLLVFGYPSRRKNLPDLVMNQVKIIRRASTKNGGQISRPATEVAFGGVQGAAFSYDYVFRSRDLTADVRNDIWLGPHCGCVYVAEAQYPQSMASEDYKVIQSFIASIEFPNCTS